jgi:hypothetical protein
VTAGLGPAVVGGVATVVAMAWGAGWSLGAEAAKSKSGKSVNTKELDVRANELQESFVRQTADLARSYEEAGHWEKAKSLLQTLVKLNPKIPGVDAKLKELDDKILTANESDLEVDTSAGWGEPCGQVFKGRPFKVQSAGEYRFMATLTVGPDGFATRDPVKEMAADVPCGALMGLIVTKGKPGKPFQIGTGQTVTPKEDGVLFLKVNVPPGHKCNGRLKVRLSGYVDTP